MTDRSALLDAGRNYLARWSLYLADHPDADDTAVSAAMQRGDPPPDTAAAADEATIAAWESSFPAAHRLYWIARAALQDGDPQKRVRTYHHRVALLTIHDAFPSKPERARLGLPATVKELAALLGVTDRSMRAYRTQYSDIFGATLKTMETVFLDQYYGRVMEALGETAATIGREGAHDRVTFLKMRKVLVDRTDVTSDNRPIQYIIENRGDHADGDSDSD